MDSIDQSVLKAIGPVDTGKLAEARKRAERKLESIIERFGDAAGERRKDWYLADLIVEVLGSMSLSEITRDLYQLDEMIGIKK
jgi:hypothetical protein